MAKRCKCHNFEIVTFVTFHFCHKLDIFSTRLISLIYVLLIRTVNFSNLKGTATLVFETLRFPRSLEQSFAHTVLYTECLLGAYD